MFLKIEKQGKKGVNWNSLVYITMVTNTNKTNSINKC
jgi:hypothetical protein